MPSPSIPILWPWSYLMRVIYGFIIKYHRQCIFKFKFRIVMSVTISYEINVQFVFNSKLFVCGLISYLCTRLNYMSTMVGVLYETGTAYTPRTFGFTPSFWCGPWCKSFDFLCFAYFICLSLCLVRPMLRVSLYCPILIASSHFSHAYLDQWQCSVCLIWKYEYIKNPRTIYIGKDWSYSESFDGLCNTILFVYFVASFNVPIVYVSELFLYSYTS